MATSDIKKGPLYVDSTNNRVGVGTVSPATPLHISGAAAAQNYATRITNTATDGYSTLQLFDDQAGIYRAGSGVSAYGGASSLNILTVGAHPVTLGTSNTVRMTVAGNGNVGIGTGSPTKPLQVRQTAAGSGLSQTDIRVTRDEYGADFSGYIDQGVGHGAIISTVNNGTPTERLRIDSGGNVGIGTSSPTQALVVSESSTPTIQIKDGAGSGTRISGRLHIGEADNLGVSIENSTTSYNDNCAMVFKTSPAAGTITERLRIESGGNVNIGSAADAGNTLRYFDVSNANTGASAGSIIRLITSNAAGSGTTAGELIKYKSGLLALVNSEPSATAQTAFYVAGAERMRIDSSGRLLVGTTVQTTSSTQSGEVSSTGAVGFMFTQTSTAANYAMSVKNNQTFASGTRGLISFYTGAGGGSLRGSITVNSSDVVVYNTTSDYRLKTDVQPITNATERLKLLNPVNFEWIDKGGARSDGFLAHEVQDIVADAVTGTKDAVDDEGNSEYQGIDQSKLVPLLVKTIQELEARIAALEAN